MKTVLIFGALLILSLQSQALPSFRLASESTGVMNQEQTVEDGNNSSIKKGDVFVFDKNYTFHRETRSQVSRFKGIYAGGCDFEMKGASEDVNQVLLTSALRWEVQSVASNYSYNIYTLTSPEAPSRTIELYCLRGSNRTDLGDMAKYGARVVRPVRIERVSFEEQRHVRIRLDGEMPDDSYGRRGIVWDGQTGDRTPRPRPGQR